MRILEQQSKFTRKEAAKMKNVSKIRHFILGWVAQGTTLSVCGRLKAEKH